MVNGGIVAGNVQVLAGQDLEVANNSRPAIEMSAGVSLFDF